MKKNIITLTAILALGTFSAQVRTVNSATNVSVTNSPAFIDASSNTTVNGSSNVGKGLIFPRVDLSAMTAFPGVTAGIPNSFPTRFDGMIVYNTASSGTAGVGSTQGTLTPGYWYYENKTSSNTGGTWKPVSTAAAGVANTASNGLTLSGNDVKMGGTLSQATTVSGLTATNTLSFTGTGLNAFSVDGSTLSADAANHRIGIGTTTPGSRLEITGTGGFDDDLSLTSNGSSYNSTIIFNKSRGTNAAPSSVSNSDFLGDLIFKPYAGNNYLTTAKIQVQVNGTVASNSVPTDLLFSTGSSVGTERMRITSSGNVGIGTSSPAAPLDVAGNVNISPKAGTASSLNLYEDTANGTNKITLKSPANVATDRSITLPANAPVSGYALVTDGSGNTSWGSVTPSASTLSSIALFASPSVPITPNNGSVSGSVTDQRFFQQFDTAIVNPLNNFNVSTGTFTAPQSGNYLVTAYIVPNAAPYNNTPNYSYPINLEVRKNCGGNASGGSIVMDNAAIRWATPLVPALRFAVNVNGMVTLAAGDTLNLVVYLLGQNSSTSDTAGLSFPLNFSYAGVTTFKALFSVTAL
ncbi:hypothetical protein [Chryseobacterium hagamense]|uniref:C1q domain-containing protein n=1 Tax=Chryseobacterium hagamense TaxID=395935 RepID=A0A511YSE7_9FLAO|nr:hypothetical protein [Chryseobacterium hagamense]GEN78096.1 hypothetical protein CHA01nite_38360 [Chryseobacterium hagamense]